MRDHSRLKRATVAVRERTPHPGNKTLGTGSTPKGHCSNYVLISVGVARCNRQPPERNGTNNFKHKQT